MHRRDEEIDGLIKEGFRALECVLEKKSRRIDIHLVTSFWNLRWHYPGFYLNREENRYWSNFFNSLFRKVLVPRIKSNEPVFILSNGFSFRDLTLSEGYEYHAVNLYDLIRLYRLKPTTWLLNAIEKLIRFSINPQYTHYYFFTNHGMNKMYLIDAILMYSSINKDFSKQIGKNFLRVFKESKSGASPLTVKFFKEINSK